MFSQSLSLPLQALVLLAGLLCVADARAADPVSRDPDPMNPPPSMDSVRIPSGNAVMNGIVYLPGGEGPFPVAVMLHGLPGDERNLDLAQVLRRDGWAVVFFHYRGAWGSSGDFSIDHVLEDVAAAVDWSLTSETTERFRFGEGARALVGHSMGGFAALAAGSAHAEVGCIASMAGANMGLIGRAAGDARIADALATSMDALVEGPLSGTTGVIMVRDLKDNAERYDLQAYVDALEAHRVLLVAGSRDRVAPPPQHHDPLLSALVRAEADVTSVVLDDDHAFSGSRVRLAGDLTNWLARGCR